MGQPVPRSAQATKSGPGYSPPRRTELRSRQWILGDRMKQVAGKFTQSQPDYQPLGEGMTRLLVLKAGSGDDEIQVELAAVKFSDLGRYDQCRYGALSYHWGAEIADKPISVASQVGSQTMTRVFVKKSLYGALQHLRYPGSPITIWVDALCINQNAQEEKAKQVARMWEIYSKAERVLVWLGVGDDSTRQTIEFLHELQDLNRLSDLIKNKEKVHCWADVMHLMRESWFSRRWVIQELALAQDVIVYCGEYEIAWRVLRDGVSLLSEKFDAIRALCKSSEQFDYDYHAIGEIESLPAKRLIDTNNNIFRSERSGNGLKLRVPICGLEFLVSSLSAYATSDPRDAIYAFMNLAKETYKLDPGPNESFKADARRRPKPDYTKDLLQVYADFVDWVVSETGSIDILCRHWAHPEKKQEDVYYPKLVTLPTWIQTVDQIGEDNNKFAGYGKQRDSFVGIPGFQGYSSYNASCNEKANVKFAAGLLVNQRSCQSPSDLQAATGDIPPSSAADTSTQTAELGEQFGISVTKIASTPKQNAPKTLPEVVFAASAAKHKTSDAFPDEASTIYHLASEGRSLHFANDELRKASESRHHAPVPKRPTPASTYSNSPTWTDGLGNTAPALKWLKDSGKDASIQIKGIRIAQITWATDPILDGVLPPQVLKTLGGENWQHSDDEGPNEKLWRSLLADRGSDGHNPPPLSAKAFQHIREHFISNSYINTKELMRKTQAPMDIIRPFLKRVQGVIWDRCFFAGAPLGALKEQDRPPLHGFGPNSTRKDDILCILFGCSVPVVLRKCWDEGVGEYYMFIGESFAYGVMDGEALSFRTREGIEGDAEWFRVF